MQGERTRVQGRCPACGPLILLPSHFECALPKRGLGPALAAFRCPACERYVFNPLTLSEARLLILLGAKRPSGVAPLELTEERQGPPLSPDELLDFHGAMEAMRFPQTELCSGPAGRRG